MGIPYGAEGSTRNVVTMFDALPSGVTWGAFGIGKLEMPMVAQSVIMGGNARVGLEDNLFLDKGVLATNAQLVVRAKEIIERLGSSLLSPSETKKKIESSVIDEFENQKFMIPYFSEYLQGELYYPRALNFPLGE